VLLLYFYLFGVVLVGFVQGFPSVQVVF
jgi:hypothetical protein